MYLNLDASTCSVPSTVIALIKPVVQGHLITVTGTFTNPASKFDPVISTTLQNIDNESASSGQQ